MCLNYLPQCGSQNPAGYGNGNGLDVWQSERPKDMANIKDLDVMCGKQHMEVTITFDKPFNGIVFSKVSCFLEKSITRTRGKYIKDISRFEWNIEHVLLLICRAP